MTPMNPNWQTYKTSEFASDIPDDVFQYRSDEIDTILAWREANPIEYPIEVEIGSNRGRFILGLARARRHTHFLGIELKSSLCRLSANKLAREGLTNGKILNADARLAIPILFRPNSLSAIYVLFPDPWWKKRHARRRLLDDSFFLLAHKFLQPNGTFVLKTDVRDYFEAVRDYLAASPLFAIIDNADIPHHESWELTTRERHCVADNTPYDMLAAQKI